MWAVLSIVGLWPLAHAGVIDKARKAEASSHQTWSAWGGDMGFRWNRGLLGNIGVTIEPSPAGLTTQSDRARHEWFALRESGGLKFLVKNGSLQSFSGGSLQMRGGYVLRLSDGSALDLRELTLRVRPSDPRILDAVSSDGKVWFYSDRIMFELADKQHVLAVRAADLRIAPALAARLGKPVAAGWEVADIAMNTQVFIQGADEQARVCAPYPWPGVAVPSVPGAQYQADLFMQSLFIGPVGCLNCTGPGGATDGIVGWAPTSQLRNNVNDGSAQATVPGDPLGTSSALYTANIAWNTKFTGSPPNYDPPYKNDQHPFLIWNLYRINANGSIEQIGRSGVKHAFLTINAGCADTCYDSHSLGLGCSDTYGVGNNDSSSDMGPRSEIVPAPGTWGRCGSIWDPTCNGQDNGNSNDDWTQRLKTHESQISATSNPGASYLMDSWYVARDDINIYNSMATLTGTPQYSGGTGGQWTFGNQANFKLGAAIDRWVNPVNPPINAKNTEIAVNEGHAKVAVKVTDNGNGTWRYDYAVMNLDFARAVVQPQLPGGGPDPHVVSNRGFDSFSVPLPTGAVVSATRFSDGDLDAANDWTVNIGGSNVTWTALASGPTLDWGTLYAFSVTVNVAPGTESGTLHIAQGGSPASFDVATLGPGTGVVPQPQATVLPTSLALSVVAGASSNGTFSLSNSGSPGTTLNYTIDVAPTSCASPGAVAWLSASPTSGAIVQGAPAATITASANAASLAAGSYSAQVCVHSNDPVRVVIAVPVALTVTAPVPAASLSPASFTFNVIGGASGSGTLNVANTGAAGSTLQYMIGMSDHIPVDCANPNVVAWLSATPASGAVAEGAAAAAVNVQANASGLTFGNHVATLCVGTNDPAQQMIQVPVNLTNTDPSDVIFIDGFDGAH